MNDRWRDIFPRQALSSRIRYTRVLFFLGEPDSEIRISNLTFLEIQSVFGMKVRDGFINREEASA